MIPGIIPIHVLQEERPDFSEAIARADRIAAKNGIRLKHLLQEARDLVEPIGPIRPRAKRMTRITDELADLVAPAAACSKGCSACCKQSVVISEWEAMRIAGAIRRNPAHVEGVGHDLVIGSPQEIAANNAAARTKYAGVPCVFLKDNLCSVYNVRPLVCRTHFNLTRDPGICDIANNPGAKVPNFNFQPLWFMQAMLFIKADLKFADIREFFPEEPCPIPSSK